MFMTVSTRGHRRLVVWDAVNERSRR
jgi:hypothetical protein